MALVHWNFSRLQINQKRFHVKSGCQKTSWISSLWTGLPTTKYNLHHHRGYKGWTWTKFNKEYLLLSYGIGKKMGNRWLEKIWKYCRKFPKICKQKVCDSAYVLQYITRTTQVFFRIQLQQLKNKELFNCSQSSICNVKLAKLEF